MTEAPKKKVKKKSQRGRGVKRKDGKARASSTGTTKPVADMSRWRRQLQSPNRLKFDDKGKALYIAALSNEGRKWYAEQAAGVGGTTVKRHMKDDPVFAEAVESALEEFRSKIVRKLEKEALEGHVSEVHKDEKGNVLRERRVYETAIRVKMLERAEPEYRSKSEHHHTGTVGVVVVPMVMTMPLWEDLVRQHDLKLAKAQDPDADDSGS